MYTFCSHRKSQKSCKNRAELLEKFRRNCLKSQANCNKSQWPSNALDEGVDHLLLPCLVEIDGELVAVDMGHPAIAEFLVEHAHPNLKPGAFSGARRDQSAVDGDGLAAGGLR